MSLIKLQEKMGYFLFVDIYNKQKYGIRNIQNR